MSKEGRTMNSIPSSVVYPVGQRPRYLLTPPCGVVFVALAADLSPSGLVEEVQLVREGREDRDVPWWWTVDELAAFGIRPE